jgi:hypothetical protein
MSRFHAHTSDRHHVDCDETRASEMHGRNAPVEDFAFADTVVAGDLDLDEPSPPSGIVINDETGHDHYLTPIPHPLPAAAADVGLATRVRFAWTRMRHGVKASRAEMNELWSATACLEHVHDGAGLVVQEEDPFLRAATVGRRVRTFFSFFEWDRADLLRAAWIGVAVFVLAATAGALALS